MTLRPVKINALPRATLITAGSLLVFQDATGKTWGIAVEDADFGGSVGDMIAATYDPQAIGSDAFGRENHTGTQLLETISDKGAMAAFNEAALADIRALTDTGLGVTTRRLKDAAALVFPSGAASWTPNWSDFITADWNVTANRTINNPTNVIPGTTRAIKIRASTSTPRMITWGSNYKGAIPTDTVTNTGFIFATMTAFSASEIVVSHLAYS